MLHWRYSGYKPVRGYVVRSRCEDDKPESGFDAAWFVLEDDARQYAALMNIINPNHNSPGSR